MVVALPEYIKEQERTIRRFFGAHSITGSVIIFSLAIAAPFVVLIFIARSDPGISSRLGVLLAILLFEGVLSLVFATRLHLVVRALRESELRHRMSEEHFRKLVNTIPDSAIFMLDSRGNVTSWNIGAHRMLGFYEHEILGKGMSHFHPPETSSEELTQILEDALEKNGIEIEGWRVRKDGSKFWATIGITPFLDAQGDVEGFVKIIRDRTERKRQDDTMKHQAFHDTLTSLPNRAYVEKEFIRFKLLPIEGRALLFLDLDKFKRINDTLGHHVGDELLREVARRLIAATRNDDVVARFGGDEFVIISKVASTDDALLIASNIFQALSDDFIVEKYHVHMSASIGIAMYPGDGNDLDTIMKNADAALYRVKEAGRNGYRLYSKDMHVQAYERVTLESEMRQALRRKEFVLYYQPILDTHTDTIIGAEALVRWNHPRLGVLLPGMFISLAEETGVIFALGDWVLEAACRQARIWHDAGFKKLTMHVNFSAHQLMRQDAASRIRSILHKTQLPANILDLEVTESTAMQNFDTIKGLFEELNNLGVGILLDDFGLGHSSLGYLKRLPITGLKIDQSFVRRSLEEEEDAALIKAMVLLARSFDIKFVAEGVETEAEKKFLNDNGCSWMQGFLFSKPVTAEEFEKLLKA